MLNWSDVLAFANQGNPESDRTVIKTDEEWREQLSAEEFRVTRQHGTEAAFSSDMCSVFEPGLYSCVCCNTLLFDANDKFESGTGWPSFTQPVKSNAISYHADNSFGMTRVETRCNTCDAHLGHVFPDGPAPSGLRYCMNAVALKKTESEMGRVMETATFGGGCFWCTEAVFEQLEGVLSVASGYAGGSADDANYQQVCSGNTDHAEVIQVVFDPEVISYETLLKIHFATHDPTTLNQQGADRGTQYRSVIFAHDDEQKAIAADVMSVAQSEFNQPITTEIADLERFYKAETYHQNYYQMNENAGYCQVVISPKLQKFRQLFIDKLKKT